MLLIYHSEFDMFMMASMIVPERILPVGMSDGFVTDQIHVPCLIEQHFTKTRR